MCNECYEASPYYEDSLRPNNRKQKPRPFHRQLSWNNFQNNNLQQKESLLRLLCDKYRHNTQKSQNILPLLIVFKYLLFLQRLILSVFAFKKYATAFKALQRMPSITFYVEILCSPLASRITTSVSPLGLSLALKKSHTFSKKVSGL